MPQHGHGYSGLWKPANRTAARTFFGRFSWFALVDGIFLAVRLEYHRAREMCGLYHAMHQWKRDRSLQTIDHGLKNMRFYSTDRTRFVGRRNAVFDWNSRRPFSKTSNLSSSVTKFHGAITVEVRSAYVLISSRVFAVCEIHPVFEGNQRKCSKELDWGFFTDFSFFRYS